MSSPGYQSLVLRNRAIPGIIILWSTLLRLVLATGVWFSVTELFQVLLYSGYYSPYNPVYRSLVLRNRTIPCIIILRSNLFQLLLVTGVWFYITELFQVLLYS